MTERQEHKVRTSEVAQKFQGSPDDLADFLNPVRTTTQLADISDPINTEDKRAGRLVWNSVTGLPVWADGPLDSDTWSDATGAVAHTPS